MAGGSLVGLDINRAARIASVGARRPGPAVRGDPGAGRRAPASGRTAPRPRRAPAQGPARARSTSSRSAADGLRQDVPAARAPLDARPNNLPTQLTTFVGRDAELDEAAALLATTRLLTLTGPGGTGKTRLSLQLAAPGRRRLPRRRLLRAARADPRPDARRAADRGGARHRRTTGARPVAETLSPSGCATGASCSSSTTSSRSSMRGPLVADLLRAAAGLKVIVTSRAALHVSGEQEYPVPGLPGAAGSEPALRAGPTAASRAASRAVDPAPLGQYEAVRLFIARAVAVRPGFAVTNDERARRSPRSAPGSTACRSPSSSPRPGSSSSRPDAILARLEHQLDVLAAGLARPAGPPADAPRRDRLELRPARRGRAAAARSPVGLRRRLRPRGGRGGLRPGRRARRRRRSTG